MGKGATTKGVGGSPEEEPTGLSSSFSLPLFSGSVPRGAMGREDKQVGDLVAPPSPPLIITPSMIHPLFRFKNGGVPERLFFNYQGAHCISCVVCQRAKLLRCISFVGSVSRELVRSSSSRQEVTSHVVRFPTKCGEISHGSLCCTSRREHG